MGVLNKDRARRRGAGAVVALAAAALVVPLAGPAQAATADPPWMNTALSPDQRAVPAPDRATGPRTGGHAPAHAAVATVPGFMRRSLWLDEAEARPALAVPPRGTSDVTGAATT